MYTGVYTTIHDLPLIAAEVDNSKNPRPSPGYPWGQRDQWGIDWVSDPL